MMSHEEFMEMRELRFFGKISASISHEIKNVLAVIGESAGLIEDLLRMEQKGLPLDTERLKTIAVRIRKQTQRADEIVRNMNHFAHSVDETIKAVEPEELVRRVATMAQRSASMRGVTVEVNTGEVCAPIVTSPFHLQHLLWLCLDFALSSADEEKRVDVGLEPLPDGVRLSFGRLKALPFLPTDDFPDEQGQALMRCLGAKLNVGDRGLTLTLPERCPRVD